MAGEGEARRPLCGPRAPATTWDAAAATSVQTNSFFGLALGFTALTMGNTVVVPVIILYKQG